MSIEEFERRNSHEWQAAIEGLGIGDRAEVTTANPQTMFDLLTAFMGRNKNHALLPSGGGLDFLRVKPGREEGCLEFAISDRSAIVCKPSSLVFEIIHERPQESFLLLDLHALPTTGIYDEDREEFDQRHGREEVVDLGTGDYADRSHWDSGVFGRNEQGEDMPLPAEARLLVRLLRGKIMIVAKSSLWNSAPSTYDGRHARMTAQDIRTVIERAWQQVGTPE